MLATALPNMSAIHLAAVDAVHQSTALYTTAHVVEALLDRVGWPTIDGRLFDPSAGDGAFLTAALARIPARPNRLSDLDRIRGWELHPEAVDQCRRRITAHLIERGWSKAVAWQGAVRIVENRDFLTEDVADVGVMTHLVGNPPFLRYHRLPDYFKTLYGNTLDRSVRGDLLHAFLDRCVTMMPHDGYVAVVTSDRWLQGDTAAALRGNLGRRAGISHLARLDASTSFYRPKTRRKGSAPRVHPVEIVLRPTALAPKTLTSAAISPDGHEDILWDGPTLGDVIDVKMAPWLGPEGIFIVNQSKADELIGAQLIPIVDTEEMDYSIRMATPAGRYAIVTNLKTEPEGKVAEHLKNNIDGMPPGKRRPQWWMPPESINLNVDSPAFIIPRIAKDLQPLRVDAGVLPTSHHLVLQCGKSKMDLDKLRDFLMSDWAKEWFERTAPRLEDGYFYVRARMLRKLPVPEQFL